MVENETLHGDLSGALKEIEELKSMIAHLSPVITPDNTSDNVSDNTSDNVSDRVSDHVSDKNPSKSKKQKLAFVH